MSLFRKEAQRDRQPMKRTNVYIALDIRRDYMLATGIAVFLVLAIIVSMFFVEYKRRVNVTGKITSSESTIRVVSNQSGVILKSFVVEGSEVEREAPLIHISAERKNTDGSVELSAINTIKDEVANLKGQLFNSRNISALQLLQTGEEIRNMERQLADLARESETQQLRTASAAETFKKFESLESMGYMSQIQMLQKRDEWLAQDARLTQLSREKSSLENNLFAAKTKRRLTAEQAELEEAKIRSANLSLDRELSEVTTKREQVLNSPIAGTVTAIQAVAGQAIVPGQPILAVIPKNALLVAKMRAPSAAMGFLQKGQEVRLRFRAFPYQKFGSYIGKVIDFNEASLDEGKQDKSESTYEVTVALDKQTVRAYGREIGIKTDMVVEADIVTESRTLIEWVFEPFFAAGRR